MEKISFEIEDTGNAVEFFVLEQTAVNGETYLLVADSQDGDAECLILKDTSEKDAQDSVMRSWKMIQNFRRFRRCLKSYWKMLILKCKAVCFYR